ncbi:toxin, partial [Escherichia coli]|nr:toxin [Escherichia coli]
CAPSFNDAVEDIVIENSSLFSIRNIQSGRLINNILDRTGKEQKGWEIIPQETPQQLKASYKNGLVKIVNPKTDQCLAVLSGRTVAKAPCASGDNITLFSFIPTTTGAVMIKNVGANKCISDVISGTDIFKVDVCITSQTETIPVSMLWMLTPPNLPAPIQ